MLQCDLGFVAAPPRLPNSIPPASKADLQSRGSSLAIACSMAIFLFLGRTPLSAGVCRQHRIVSAGGQGWRRGPHEAVGFPPCQSASAKHCRRETCGLGAIVQCHGMSQPRDAILECYCAQASVLVTGRGGSLACSQSVSLINHTSRVRQKRGFTRGL